MIEAPLQTTKKGYIDKSRLFIRDDLAESIRTWVEDSLSWSIWAKKNQTHPDIDTDKINIVSRSRIPFFTNFESGLSSSIWQTLKRRGRAPTKQIIQQKLFKVNKKVLCDVWEHGLKHYFHSINLQIVKFFEQWFKILKRPPS